MTSARRAVARGGAERRLYALDPELDSDEMIAQLDAVAAGVNAGTDLDTMLRSIVEAVVAHSPWTMCWAGLVDPETKTLIADYLAGMTDPAKVYGAWSYSGTPSERAILRDTALVYGDVQSQAGEFPQFQAEARLAGYRSTILLPIRLGRRVGGVLQLTRPDVHDFSDIEISLAKIVASFAAAAFRNVLAESDAVEIERLTNARLRELNAIIRAQNDVLVALSNAHERLLRGQLQSDGADAQCAHIAQLLDAPVLLLDRFGQTASEAGFEAREGAQLAERLRQRWQEVRRMSDRPQLLDMDGRDILVVRVSHQEECVAVIAVAAAVVDEPRLRMLATYGLHVALEVANQRASLDAEMRLEADFVGALLAVDGGGATLSKRAGMLGVRLDRPFVVLHSLVTGAPEVGRRDATQISVAVAGSLERLGIDTTAAAIDGGAYVFVMTPPATRELQNAGRALIRQGLRERIAAVSGASPRSISVSTGAGEPGTGADGLHSSYAQASRALDVLRARGLEDADLSIDEAGSYALLTSVDASERRSFVQMFIQPLIDYDRGHGSDYVGTLRVYFDAVGNAQRVAAEMFLHISTVRYRLNRIEEIIGVSLRDAEARLCLQLALHLTDLRTAR